jgi:hypothetical protein
MRDSEVKPVWVIDLEVGGDKSSVIDHYGSHLAGQEGRVSPVLTRSDRVKTCVNSRLVDWIECESSWLRVDCFSSVTLKDSEYSSEALKCDSDGG